MSHRDRITTAGLLAFAAACAQSPDVSTEPVEPAPVVEETANAAAETSAEVNAEEATKAIPASVDANAETVEAVEAAAAAVAAEPVAQEGDDEGAEAATTKREMTPTKPVARDTSDLTALMVSYFNTQEYKKLLALNFIPRGETEPEFDPAEIEDMQKVFELRSRPTDGSEGEEKQKTDRVVALLERMWAKNRTPHTAVQLAFEYQSRGRLRDAAELYRGAVDKDTNYGYPKFLRAWQQLAAIHFQLANGATDMDAEGNEVALEDDPVDHYAQAQRAFQKAIGLGLVNEQNYGYLGLTLLARQRYIEAESAFRNALMMSDVDNTLYRNWRQGLVQSYFKQRRYADAAAMLGTLIDETPNDAKLWLFQGNAYIGLGDAKRAAENFQIAYQLGGADAPALLTLGDIYVNDGLAEDAVDRYLAAIELDTGKAPRTLRGARSLLRLSEIDALSRLLAGIEEAAMDSLDADSRGEVRRLKSQVAVRRGDSAGQVAILREVIEEDPMDGDALILLGEALGKGARDLRALMAEANAAHETAVADAAEKGEPAPERAPESDAIKTLRVQVEEAYQVLETAAAIEGFESGAKVAHAKILVSQKRFDEAVPLLKSALEFEDKENVRRFLEGVEQAAKRAGS